MAIKTTTLRTTLAKPSWDRLKDILDEALAQPSSAARAALIKSRCAGDVELQREAESLLAGADSLDKEPTDWWKIVRIRLRQLSGTTISRAMASASARMSLCGS